MTSPPPDRRAALVAAPLLALALALAPLLAQGACRHGGDAVGVAAVAPQPTALQARGAGVASAALGGVSPTGAAVHVRTSSPGYDAGSCRPARAGEVAPAPQAAWGRLQLDGG